MKITKMPLKKEIIVNYNPFYDIDKKQRYNICVKGQLIPTQKNLDECEKTVKYLTYALVTMGIIVIVLVIIVSVIATKLLI